MMLFLAAIFLVLCLAGTPLAAMESAPFPAAPGQEGSPNSSQESEKPDTGLDPTVQTSKLGLQHYFNKHPHAGYLYQLNLKGTFAFGFSGKNDCAISVALPAVAHFDPGNMPGVAGATGIGDTNLELVKIFAFGQLAHAPVLDVYFRPSNPNLGDTASTGTVLGPGYAASYPFTDNIHTLLLVQYQWTPERAAGTAYVSNLLIRPFIICYWPHLFFTMTEFRVNPDFRHNRTYLIPSGILGRFLNEKKNLILTATLDVPVDHYTRTNSEQFKLKVTFNYFFK
jgi:hypothetical protein